MGKVITYKPAVKLNKVSVNDSLVARRNRISKTLTEMITVLGDVNVQLSDFDADQIFLIELFVARIRQQKSKTLTLL
jgi:hypothetical protein